MRLLILRTAAALALAAAGCTASSDEVQPVADQFYFPTGAAMVDGGGFLVVTNANSDLRFDSGHLSDAGAQLFSRLLAQRYLETREDSQ